MQVTYLYIIEFESNIVVLVYSALITRNRLSLLESY